MLDPRQMPQPLSLHLKMKKEGESDNREGLFSASPKKKATKDQPIRSRVCFEMFLFSKSTTFVVLRALWKPQIGSRPRFVSGREVLEPIPSFRAHSSLQGNQFGPLFSFSSRERCTY